MTAAGRRERALDLALLLPLIGLLAAFLFYPLVYGLDLSLNRTEGFEVTGSVGLEHYARALLGDAVFREGLANTLVFTAAAVVLQTGLGLLLAVLVAETRRGRTLFRIAFVVPFILAPVAAGTVWKFMYAPFFGIVPSVGGVLGLNLSGVAPLADPGIALWAIVLVFAWRFAGFSMVVYLAAMQSIPREYYEQGELDGIGRLARLRRITWPLLWPQTFALTLLTSIASLRVFDLVWIMTAGGPGHATETVATYVYTTAFRSLDVGYAQAMATILMVLIVGLAIVEYRLLNPRVEAVST
ncbi:MAG TPA: sugar ABC transporter permease [Candidatus Limnocylindrales bacterium]|nr:sugar ABC transporter permease [Candidatus Limnocylindrales bacterium]